MRDGKLEVTIGESQAFGGIAKGSLGLASTKGGVAADLALCSSSTSIWKIASVQVFGAAQARRPRQSGASTSKDPGASVLAVDQHAQRHRELTAHGGALAGINVEQLLRRLERRPLSGNGDFRSGRTPFDQLALTLKIDAGPGLRRRHALDRSGGAACGGRPGFGADPRPRSQGRGNAGLERAANEFDLPFVVQGQWDDPIMLPDAQSLIRRSGAAAPLLESSRPAPPVRAVRAVIDKLLANPARPLPPHARRAEDPRLADRRRARHGRRRAARSRVSLASSEAAITATPTTAIMMLHTAFISGFTPSRTSE